MFSDIISRKKLKKVNFNKGLAVCAAFCALTIAKPVLSDVFISSFLTNQVMRFDENTGKYLNDLEIPVNGPFASQIGFNGDLFVSSFHTGEVLRFDSYTGKYLGPFITAGSGGLTNPTAPNFGPDGKVYVGDLATNRVLRFDENGKFLDVFADSTTSDLNGPFMQAYDDTSMYIASGFTNSILRYDLKTKKFMGHFVKPDSGGLKVPVGLEFGPDGNLYAGSSDSNSVLRFNGKTGEFIDEFVPPSPLLDSPRAIRFGGPNSDLYVNNFNKNEVLKYDRSTGAFLGVVMSNQSGFVAPRGLTFTPKPDFFVEAFTKRVEEKHGGFFKVNVKLKVKDFTDDSPKIELLSIAPNTIKQNHMNKYVRGASFGSDDTSFYISSKNQGLDDLVYTITYRATNKNGGTSIATTTVSVPPSSSMHE